MDPNPSSPERMRQLFWQGQSNSKRTSGWGLRVNLNNKLDGPQHTERGFVDCAWPSQLFRIDNPASDGSQMYHKATSYIQNGRLIQVVAIICDNDSSDISWEVGGEVQMWNDHPITLTTDPDYHHTANYTANVSKLTFDESEMTPPTSTTAEKNKTEINVLTVEGQSHFENEKIRVDYDEDIICMDVAVFLNRKSQELDVVNPTATEHSVNFTRGKSPIKLARKIGQCFVAVFSLRDKGQELKPETMICPSWPELKARLGIKKIGMEKIQRAGPSLLNLHAELREKSGISQLNAMPDIITRTVEQLRAISIHSKLPADDFQNANYDNLFEIEPPHTASSPHQTNGMRDHETGDQSRVSIANNLGIEPGLGQLIHESYL
jgi:hypothetical protein